MKRKVIAAFDGSDNAQESLRIAIELAEKYDDSILVINVQPSFETLHTKMFFNKSMIRDYQESLYKDAIAPALKILEETGTEYEAKLRIGDPKAEICKEAQEQDARWIVMGAHGYNPVVRSVLGSVSQGVLQRATCPVLIIPAHLKAKK